MGKVQKHEEMSIHSRLRSSERVAPIVSVSDLVKYGVEVKKRNKFAKYDGYPVSRKCYLYNNFVYIISPSQKIITIIPFSKRKWKIKETK